jgi:hypothetical protein
MASLITFFVAGFAAWAHYELAGRVVISGTPFTVWRCWYAAVLLACLYDVLRAKDIELRSVWCIMLFSYVASFMTWDMSARPLEDNALRMIIVMAAALIVTMRTEVVLLVGLHGAIIFAAYLASAGVLPKRTAGFLVWSFPDISAALQHVSLILLGGYTLARNRILDMRSDDRRMDFIYSRSRVARVQSKEASQG